MYYKNTHNNFLLAFIDELWKTQKIRILKKWKRKLLEILSFYVCVPKPTIRYSSRDTEWDKCFFVILGYFLSVTSPSNTPENQNFEKIKKASGYVIILNLCNKNTIKWCMFPQIWRPRDIIFCHFRSFFAVLRHCWLGNLKFGKNVKSMMYGSWHIKHNRQNFLSFWVIFEKMEKATEDTIILHKCTVNDNHMMYGSWDINCNRHIFLSSLAIFCPFYPTISPKKENVKNVITPGDIIILQKCTKTHDHRLYCFWDMVCAGCNSYFSFWVIFHHFTQVYQKSWSYANLFLRYDALHM